MKKQERLLSLGDRFGRLVVIRDCERWEWPDRNHAYECLCDCGNTKIVRMGSLKKGESRTCGCSRVEAGLRHRTHGGTVRGQRHPLYETWCSMKKRCYNANCVAYPDYGGRGIKVCDEWKDDFQRFVNDVGEPPGPGYSIDRIDNDGYYEPGNVRWATWKEQRANRRPMRAETYCRKGLHLLAETGIRNKRTGHRTCSTCVSLNRMEGRAQPSQLTQELLTHLARVIGVNQKPRVITTDELAKVGGVSGATAHRHLVRLETDGLVQRLGSKRNELVVLSTTYP